MSREKFKSLWDLTKPRITFFCVMMALVGLIESHASWNFSSFVALVGVAFSVASANTLNMYWERDIDALMKRTRGRPLPSGKLSPQTALYFGLSLGVLSVILLAAFVNYLTAAMAVFAIVSYVLIYTPLKQKTEHALIIGAIPGAIPPLMGRTAVIDRIDSYGIFLFLVLLLWQIPHFVAIAMRFKNDYANAGIKTITVVRGEQKAARTAFIYSLILCAVTLFYPHPHQESVIYLLTSLALGGWLVWLGYKGVLKDTSLDVWSKKMFFASLFYLPIFSCALIFDRWIIR